HHCLTSPPLSTESAIAAAEIDKRILQASWHQLSDHCESRQGADLCGLLPRARARRALGRPTSCCNSDSEVRSLFSTSAPARVIRKPRASPDLLGSANR